MRITQAEVARKSHRSRTAVSNAVKDGRLDQDDNGYLDDSDPSVSLYIQRGVAAWEVKTGLTTESEQKQTQKKNNKKTNEQIFIETLQSVLMKEFKNNETRLKKVMTKIFETYSEAISD